MRVIETIYNEQDQTSNDVSWGNHMTELSIITSVATIIEHAKERPSSRFSVVRAMKTTSIRIEL